MRPRDGISALLLAALAAPAAVRASDLDEFRVKRQAVFEFSEKPEVVASGDKLTIRFAAGAYCDATVAIEDAAGRIIRHLASGVLGENAPAPLTKGTLRQAIVWDGKNDQGRYVDDRAGLRVRVSLGLRARLERVLFWDPRKRIARGSRPLIAACPEGVLVFEGEGADHLRLFDHQGNYLRTVYPFPAGKLAEVKGLQWAEFPQDGRKLPLKHGLVQASFLTSGKNIYHSTLAKYQPAATAMAVRGGRIALAGERLNRLAIDGTTPGSGSGQAGGLELDGPEVGIKLTYAGANYFVQPGSAAFSPDGRHLYVTGFRFKPKYPRRTEWLPCVLRLEYASGKKAEVFAGSAKTRAGGSGEKQFRVPTSVAVDAQGRVYVADYMNDRVQVFTADGKLVGSIKVHKPVEVAVHQKSGEIYVASWMILNRFSKPGDVKKPTLTRLGPADAPKVLASHDLPLADHNPKVFMNKTGGYQYSLALDSWADEPTIWLIPAHLGFVSKLMIVRGQLNSGGAKAGMLLLTETGGKLVVKRDFGKEVVKAVRRATPAVHARQKLYVNPADGKLYVFEGQAGVNKSVNNLLSIDPATGAIGELPLPFDAEDLTFGPDGLLYARTDNVVGRFRRAGGKWIEVPYDYGEERKSVGFSSSRGGRRCALTSALIMPSTRPGCFHQGGMGVGPTGRLVVTNYNIAKPAYRKGEMREVMEAGAVAAGRPYTPRMYPGRKRWNEVHVWDAHGQVLHEDAVAGVTMMDGIAIDRSDNIYMMVAANRVLDGKPYHRERAETLLKVRPGKARISSGRKGLPVPLTPRPKRPPELRRSPDGEMWIEGHDWLYGGVGYGGFNSSRGGGGCACWSARFALDAYARSFAPEVDHFSVAVLDTNGNLIMRIGRYGNADDGKPTVAQGAPAKVRSVGGDEVALMDAAYVAAHTDRRLFVADGGNQRILSVKLDYHTTETVSLKARAGDGPRTDRRTP